MGCTEEPPNREWLNGSGIAPDKSASKKVAVKLFIFHTGAEPLSSAPVWAEPSQFLIEMCLFEVVAARRRYLTYRFRTSSPASTCFAEPMTAALADLGELARPPSTFTAFRAHFLSASLTNFNGGFCCCSATRVSLASWTANRELNLLRASSVVFNIDFLFGLK
jgi:hypothetical protein